MKNHAEVIHSSTFLPNTDFHTHFLDNKKVNKTFSIILIFSISLMATPCNYFMKKREMVHSYRYYKTRLNVFQNYFSSKDKKDLIVNLLKNGLEQNVLDRRTIDYLTTRLKKLENSTDDFTYFNEIYTALNKTIKPDHQKRDIISRFQIGTSLQNHFLERSDFLKKLQISDLILLKKQINSSHLPIDSKQDVDLLVDLFFLADHQSSFDKYTTVNSIQDIYNHFKNKTNINSLSKKQKKIAVKYQKINTKMNKFNKSLKNRGVPEQQANIYSNRYKSQKLMCKARTLKPTLFKSSSSKYKSLVYAMGFASVMGGYLYSELGIKNAEDAFSKESFEKFGLELIVTIIGTAIGTKIITTEKLNNVERLFVEYLYRTVMNGAEAKAYDMKFVDKLQTDLPKVQVNELKDIIKEFSKSEVISKIFDRINNSNTPDKEIAKILKEVNYDKDAPVSDEFVDAFQQLLSIQMNYDEKFSENIIKTNDEALDRFHYNNSVWGVFSTFKSIGLGIVSYNLFCQGTVLGSLYVGGATQVKTAIYLSMLIMLLDRVGSTYLYYKERIRFINQGF